MNAQMHGEETIEPRMRALDADPGREKDPHSYEQRKGGLAQKAQHGARLSRRAR
jgi:hypothetical protein